jgi:hypothetical protein
MGSHRQDKKAKDNKILCKLERKDMQWICSLEALASSCPEGSDRE